MVGQGSGLTFAGLSWVYFVSSGRCVSDDPLGGFELGDERFVTEEPI